MKRFGLAFLAYIALFIGLFAALFTVFAFLDPERDAHNLHYFFGGAAVVSFVVSWLLLNLSRKSG